MADQLSYGELIGRLRRYRDEREWAQFHTLKDLAIAVSTEAAELLECFLWRSDHQLDGHQGEIEEEIADVAIYLVFLCDALDVDLLEVMKSKLEHNLARHTVPASRGRSRPDS